jgi:hypothetical protein
LWWVRREKFIEEPLEELVDEYKGMKDWVLHFEKREEKM